MAYATVDQLRDRVQLTSTDYDDVLSALIDAAGDTIDDLCNRPDGFESSSAAREFAGNGKQSLMLPTDFTAITLLETKSSATDSDYTEWDSGDYVAFSGSQIRPNFYEKPYNGVMVTATGSQSVFTSGRFTSTSGFRPDPDTVAERWLPTVRITATWGYADTVPDAIREATIVIAARWWKRGEGSWADSVGSADIGIMLFRQKLDPDAALMLKLARYIKPVY